MTVTEFLDLERVACSKPCSPQVKTSRKARLADAARTLDGLLLFFAFSFSFSGFWMLFLDADILRLVGSCDLIAMPHESLTKENPGDVTLMTENFPYEQ
jgi:hypothetical protein